MDRWACDSCTLWNEGGATCVVCYENRPGMWTCPACLILNVPARESCQEGGCNGRRVSDAPEPLAVQPPSPVPQAPQPPDPQPPAPRRQDSLEVELAIQLSLIDQEMARDPPAPRALPADEVIPVRRQISQHNASIVVPQALASLVIGKSARNLRFLSRRLGVRLILPERGPGASPGDLHLRIESDNSHAVQVAKAESSASSGSPAYSKQRLTNTAPPACTFSWMAGTSTTTATIRVYSSM
jgi:hypothetical protein